MWRVFGRSVTGASHRRRAIPNQDALGWNTASGGATVLAVADGHGSSACFRSETGAAFAVKASLELMAGFCSEIDFAKYYLDDFKDEFKRRLMEAWRQEVSRHLAENPFSASELTRESDPFVAYGSTLLAARAGEKQLLLAQIGDGDILMVSSTGQVLRPWPRDERHLGVETTSLCTEDAAANIRLRVEPLTPEFPRLILLCTDGYSNSFRADAGFLKVGTDLLEMIEADGPDSVEHELEGWLEEASRLGSGDDVTLGVLFRTRENGNAV